MLIVKDTESIEASAEEELRRVVSLLVVFVVQRIMLFEGVSIRVWRGVCDDADAEGHGICALLEVG